jgi:hypothetical protein
MSKYSNTIESFGRRQKNELNKLTVIDNRPVTVGNSFKIIDPNGYAPIEYIPDTKPVKVLASVDNEPETVIIPSQNTSFVKSFLNSF